jgi:hypothetical protein
MPAKGFFARGIGHRSIPPRGQPEALVRRHVELRDRLLDCLHLVARFNAADNSAGPAA